MFDIVNIYRAGVKHLAADALSRLPTRGEDHTLLDDDLPILAIGAPTGSSFDLIKQKASQKNYN